MQIESPDGEIVTEAPPVANEVIQRQADPPQAEPEPEPEPQPKGILDDLRAERAERKALSTKVRELEQQAHKAQQLEAELGNLRTQLEALKPKAPVVPDIPDEIAEATATRYGIYTLEGKPDLKAGRAILNDLRSEAKQIASELIQREVEPLRKSTLEQRGEALVAKAIAKVTADKSCSPETLQQVLSGLAPDQKANPDVINAAMVLASGIDARQGRMKPPARAAEDTREPIFTEAAGGRRLAPGPLTAIEQRAAKDAGMTSEQWKKATDVFDPTKATRLE